jgi:hypothetical protein
VDFSAAPMPLAEAEAFVSKRARDGFDLGVAPLAQVILCRLAAQDALILILQHHLITDAVSMQVLTRELAACYAARLTSGEPSLASLATDLGAYAMQEREWLASPDARASEQFWREQLSGATPLRLVQHHDQGRGFDRTTQTITARLPGDGTRLLSEVAAQAKATNFMAVTAAYAAVLHRWSGQPEVLIGTTVENRPSRDLDNVLGCFVNSVGLRLDCSGDPNFKALVGRVRKTVLDAYRHQRIPFNHVVHAVGGWTDPRRMPLFQVTSDWVDLRQVDLVLEGCSVTASPLAMNASRYELSLYTAQRQDGFELSLEYAVGLWDHPFMAERLGELVAFLEAAVRTPDEPISILISRAAHGARR